MGSFNRLSDFFGLYVVGVVSEVVVAFFVDMNGQINENKKTNTGLGT